LIGEGVTHALYTDRLFPGQATKMGTHSTMK
jgi:hypothetical protein